MQGWVLNVSREKSRNCVKALHMVLPSECSSIFGLSLSVGEDMAGENGHGGSVPDHRVDVLEPPSLSPSLYH